MSARLCPRCERETTRRWCCGLDLAAARGFSMTPARIREVHGLRARKGLTDEIYRLRLGAVGAESCKEFTRTQFFAFMRTLRELPDSPAWVAKRAQARSARKARG